MVTTGPEADAVADAPEDRSAAEHRARRRKRTLDLLAVGIILAAFLIPLRGLLRTTGPTMEEGFMLAFPERLLRGEIPNKDFLHLYGPGSLWVLAGVYKVFGATLEVERLFGLLQQMGVAFGAFAVGRWWGRRVAVVCGLLATVIMLPPAGLTAFAWTGGVALGLCGLAVGLHARATPDDRRGTWLAAVAGVLFGVAFLFRLDLVIACGLAALVLVWRAPRRRVVALLGAAAATASLVLIQFVMAGFANAFRGMVLDPVFKLRPGRRLPVPPSWGSLDGFLQRVGDAPDQLPWPLPTLPSSNQLFLWFFFNLGAIAVLVGVGVWAVRRDATSIRARAVLASGLFSLGMVMQTLQRPDSTHIAWVSCVSIGLLPIALMELLGARAAHRGGRSTRHTWLVACGVPVLAMLLVVPTFTFRAYADHTAQTFGKSRKAFLIERNGVRFYYGDVGMADAANAMIPTLDELIEPGDRLFVGPADLRKTVTSEAWIYALYPEAVPGTYFIEMDPGIANAEGSRLADDLRSSDVAVLSRFWLDWDEPNDSVKLGDPTANRVLKRDFCLVEVFEPWFEVYRRCDRPAP